MPRIIRQLDARLKGTLQETEDWWRLMRGDDGALYVEHSWSHTKLNGLKSDDGHRDFDLNEFLNDDHPWADKARAELRKYLAEQGEG